MVTPYFLPVKGGITSFVRGLAEQLRVAGVEVSIIARTADNTAEVTVVNRGTLGFMRETAAVLRRIQPHVIHAHAHWYALKAALKASMECPVAFTFHSAWPKTGFVRTYLAGRMLAKCRAVTFPSRSLLASSTVRIPEGLISIVPPGTHEARVDRSSARSFVSRIGEIGWSSTIGYVGKFEWPAKVEGFRLLLEALTRPALSQVGLIAAGGGTYLQYARSVAARLGISNRVRFLGDVSNPEMIYAGCDIYCHPSLQEGLSLSVLEAMRVGAPIVGFRLPFMEEAIRNGIDGLLADPTPDALSSSLATLISDKPLAARLGGSAKDRARIEFDWSTISQRFLELYGVAE